MGTKDVARETMEEAGVPIVPGSTGIVADDRRQVLNWQRKLAFQLSLKQLLVVAVKEFVLHVMKKSLVKGIKITQKEAAAAFR